MPVITELRAKGQQKTVKIWTNEVDYQTQEQLRNTASLPFIYSHIAAMPDVHLGKGATVGSVIASQGAIIPAAVGVDIGCGMDAQPLGLKASELPDDLHSLRLAIEQAVPLGVGGEHKREQLKQDHPLPLN
ncbi:RtcB family protein [Dongshaea marina]|uniref:RtcB family protein n=1 Tax=Dongshaea marina TaxID=2047966 RepID=UPI002D77B09F|nr:RtcB family protein [Dongshaea marina]